MREIVDPQYILFVETGKGKVCQVALTDEQRSTLAVMINAICDGQIKIGKEMEIRYASDQV